MKFLRPLSFGLFFLLSLAPLTLLVAQDVTEIQPLLPDEPLVTEKSLPPELQQERFYMEFVKMIVILTVIIGVLMAVMWFVRRMLTVRIDQMNRASHVQIVEKRILSPKTTLYIMDIDEKRILFAESNQGVTLLAETRQQEQ